MNDVLASVLPEVIRGYLDTHDRGDTEAAIAAFTADARVYDEDHEYRGTAAIRGWMERTAAAYTYTRTLTGAQRLEDGGWLLHNHLEGDFPGGVVDLRYRVVLLGDRIADLAITL